MIFRSQFPMVMNVAMLPKLLSGCYLLLAASATGQTKAELEKQRDELNSKIKYTQKLIDESRQGQSSATRELQALERQITLRSRLIRNLGAEVREMEDETQRRQEEIQALNASIQQLKDEYAQMIYQAYKNRNSYDKLMYIFAAEDFNQAFMRMKLMQRYGEVRGRHKEEIEFKYAEQKAQIAALENLKAERVSLLESKSNEKAELDKDRGTRKQALSSLKDKEQELRKTQQQQERRAPAHQPRHPAQNRRGTPRRPQPRRRQFWPDSGGTDHQREFRKEQRQTALAGDPRGDPAEVWRAAARLPARHYRDQQRGGHCHRCRHEGARHF